ncbi:MAG: MlaD family protein, partial [Streptosporangiales bacterium]|nr:MlaD family protein [Streptosporangiales bacterium]
MDTGLEGREARQPGPPGPPRKANAVRPGNPRPGKRPARPGTARSRREGRARLKRQAYGLGGIAAVAALIAGTIAAYAQVFTPSVPATVLTGRVGLLMTPGASVTLYGADVGTVTSVTPDGDQARIGISVTPGEVRNIPSNVAASIQAPTVFGPKFLSLRVPARETAKRLQADQVIEPAQTPTEIDTVFANLVTVLDSLHPARLDATLGAISTA